MKRINFVRSDIDSTGNLSDNTVNLRSTHQSAHTVGTQLLPIKEDEKGRYVNRIIEVIGKPTRSKYPTKGKDGAKWDMSVPVRTVLESPTRIYIRKNEVAGHLTFGNTAIHSKETTTDKKNAYRAFERIVALMVRS